jgi:endonuclease/exonuclease/phosphatase family metal-dependent hydrolase
MSVAMGATALLLATGLTTGPRPAAAAGPVRVMQFNFCGAICNTGVVDKPGNHNDVVEDIRNRIVSSRPHLVFLNEACQSQVARLKNLLAGSSWEMDGVFRAQRDDDRCKGDGGFGDAVLSAGSKGATRVLELPDMGKEHRAVLCLRTNAGGPVLACTLHLVTKDPEKAKQLAAATKHLNAAARGGAVVVGGDFNVSPNRMEGLLDPGRGGRFFDVDPQKAPTRGQKIDYVLFSRGDFSNPSGGPGRSRYSDHRVLSGGASRH